MYANKSCLIDVDAQDFIEPPNSKSWRIHWSHLGLDMFGFCWILKRKSLQVVGGSQCVQVI